MRKFSFQALLQPLSGRLRPVAALLGVYLCLFTALRLILQARFGASAGVGVLLTPPIVLGGLINDAFEAVYLLLPLVLLVSLASQRVWGSPAFKWAFRALVVVVLTALLFIAAAEYFFFEEFDARFNIVAFDYLMYPTEVVGDIRSEYPVGAILLGALALAIATCCVLRRWLPGATRDAVTLRRRLWIPAVWGLLATLLAVAWPSNALSFFDNRVARELIQNGHSTFFQALRTSELDYHAYYRSAATASNLAVLTQHLGAAGGRFVALDEGRLDREFPADPNGLGKLNVVLIASESFGAEFSKLHGSERDWTPNFDRYAQRGIWFSNAYASGTRTVRGLEALTCSIPPTPPESVVRRSGGPHISNWGDVMRSAGYHTSFLYGGYGYFDNMNAFYQNNGFEVLDRAAITHVRFENIWGVSDEDLFDRALDHFDDLSKAGKPFFSIVMTTSNHKPFTFRSGLDALGIPQKGGGREAGVRYADFALGQFLENAGEHAWFKNTVFVVIADHGARVYGRQDIPLKTYEIPAMIYAPAHLAPRKVATLFGQIDVAPTVLGLLGLAYRAPFFGVDVLKHPEVERIALFNHNHDIALMRSNELVVLGLNQSRDFLTYDARADTYAHSHEDARLEGLAIAYYQTAFELFRKRSY